MGRQQAILDLVRVKKKSRIGGTPFAPDRHNEFHGYAQEHVLLAAPSLASHRRHSGQVQQQNVLAQEDYLLFLEDLSSTRCGQSCLSTSGVLPNATQCQITRTTTTPACGTEFGTFYASQHFLRLHAKIHQDTIIAGAQNSQD